MRDDALYKSRFTFFYITLLSRLSDPGYCELGHTGLIMPNLLVLDNVIMQYTVSTKKASKLFYYNFGKFKATVIIFGR